MLGNDLCGLFGGSQLGQRRSGDTAVLNDEILQIPAGGPATGISGRFEREGIMSPIGPRPWACGWSRWNTRICGDMCCVAIAGVVSRAAQW